MDSWISKPENCWINVAKFENNVWKYIPSAVIYYELQEILNNVSVDTIRSKFQKKLLKFH